MSMTAGQETANKLICQWIDDKESMIFRLGGPAGSGKSWLIPLIAEHVGYEKCLFMTPTGKAANRLIKAGLEAHTIHSQIYQPKTKVIRKDMDSLTDPMEMLEAINRILNYQRLKEEVNDEESVEYVLKSADSFKKIKLFIIDEGSMVGEKLLDDIMSFGVPVLLIGDPNQLDPVNDNTVFDKCDYYLTEIVRQAQDSPVIWLSQQVLNGSLPTGAFGTCQVRYGGIADNEFMYADQVLADTNKTRESLNSYMRNLWFKGKFMNNQFIEGDKIICRTNSIITSDAGFTLTNGAQGVIKEIKHSELNGTLINCVMHTDELGDFTFVGAAHPERIAPECRPPKIEHAYAITVHLSQGSEWDNVIYVPSKYMDKARLYTAVTRAKQGVLISLSN